MSSRTVFFVGMHNKPGLRPLDSSTKTGKVVDRIIDGLIVDYKKTNLCDSDYKPNESNIKHFVYLWPITHAPGEQDVIVLLGDWVARHFNHQGYKILKLRHPASIRGTKKIEKYIEESINQINNLCYAL
jgi:hypothetical protein